MKFAAVLLAADREPENPVARAAGSPCKALASLEGKTMLARVLDALEACPAVDQIVLCGPPRELCAESLLETRHKPLSWIPPQDSPSLSAQAGMARIAENIPVLLTTADLAFPAAGIFTEFCHRASISGSDVAVGLVPYREVAARYPGVRRTPLKFSDGPFCTCNLFAFLTPRGRHLVEFWRRLEQERKRPWRLIRALGIGTLIRYLGGRLSSDDLVRKVAQSLGIQVSFIILPHPQAAIDVDSETDLMLVRRLLAQRSIPGGGL